MYQSDSDEEAEVEGNYISAAEEAPITYIRDTARVHSLKRSCSVLSVSISTVLKTSHLLHVDSSCGSSHSNWPHSRKVTPSFASWANVWLPRSSSQRREL